VIEISEREGLREAIPHELGLNRWSVERSGKLHRSLRTLSRWFKPIDRCCHLLVTT
jgi:hypothetical protein